MKYILAGLISFFLAVMPVAAQDQSKTGVWTQKDEIFDMIENCDINRSREDIRDHPSKPVSVKCKNKCIETKLNAWFKEDDANKNAFFTERSVYSIERAAGLLSCRKGEEIFERTACLGVFAPDVIEKLGYPNCQTQILCEARFDIDLDGRPINTSATCDTELASEELERETLCLLETMDYPSHAGRKKVVQPFEMRGDEMCPTS